MVFWDMPFGLGVADWDVKLSDLEIQMLFKQLDIINTATSWVVCLVVHVRDYGRVERLMEDHGFVDIHPFYVYKPNQNQKGVGCFIFAVEVVIVAATHWTGTI